MFTLRNGGSHTTGTSIADGQAHELHHEPAGPLDGELLDLYAAILIVVPLALFLKSVLF
jgi:hypothetical protein